jgi:hypothetical protein
MLAVSVSAFDPMRKLRPQLGAIGQGVRGPPEAAQQLDRMVCRSRPIGSMLRTAEALSVSPHGYVAVSIMAWVKLFTP